MTSLSKNEMRSNRELRDQFMSIGVFEHHQLVSPTIDSYDISVGLATLWTKLCETVKVNRISLDKSSILSLHERVARVFGQEPGEFRDPEGWCSFLEECDADGVYEDADSMYEEDLGGYVESWVFSALYWNHLTRFRLATAWLFMNALRVQYGHETCSLPLANLGRFLDRLSGSGPPMGDGQTFSPDDYSK